MIKQRQRNCYNPQVWPNQESGLSMARIGYKRLCTLFEINPDEYFPDW